MLQTFPHNWHVLVLQLLPGFLPRAHKCFQSQNDSSSEKRGRWQRVASASEHRRPGESAPQTEDKRICGPPARRHAEGPQAVKHLGRWLSLERCRCHWPAASRHPHQQRRKLLACGQSKGGFQRFAVAIPSVEPSLRALPGHPEGRTLRPRGKGAPRGTSRATLQPGLEPLLPLKLLPLEVAG